MSNKLIEKGKKEKKISDYQEDDTIAKYNKSSYFKKKDKQAKDFLKKNPLPAKFVQQ